MAEGPRVSKRSRAADNSRQYFIRPMPVSGLTMTLPPIPIIAHGAGPYPAPVVIRLPNARRYGAIVA